MTQESERNYQWEQCPITIAIHLSPVEPGETDRSVCIGVRSYQDVPLLKFVHLSELELPSIVLELLTALQHSLPERALQHHARSQQPQAQHAAATQKVTTPSAKPPSPPSLDRNGQMNLFGT
jgi:hypothetical protein